MIAAIEATEKLGGPIRTACGALGWGFAVFVICIVVVLVAPIVRWAITKIKGPPTSGPAAA